jgi:predicted ATP-binding protein involved in virulence
MSPMKAAGPPKEYASGKSPLLSLIEQAIKAKYSRQIYIRDENLTVWLEKRKEAQLCNSTKLASCPLVRRGL